MARDVMVSSLKQVQKISIEFRALQSRNAGHESHNLQCTNSEIQVIEIVRTLPTNHGLNGRRKWACHESFCWRQMKQP